MCKKLDYWWRSKAKHHTKSWAYWSLEFFPSSSSTSAASSSLCFDLLSLHTLHSTNIKQICSMLLLDLRGGLLSWLTICWWWGLRWCWSVTLYSLHLKVNIEWRHFTEFGNHFKSCHRSIGINQIFGYNLQIFCLLRTKMKLFFSCTLKSCLWRQNLQYNCTVFHFTFTL